jgi:hypothetical protein
MERTEHNTRV